MYVSFQFTMTQLTKDFNELITIDHQQMVDTNSLDSQQYQEHYITRWLRVLSSVDADDFVSMDGVKNALVRLGKNEQTQLWELNDALKQPLQRLMDDQYSGEKINNHLRELQKKITNLHPPKKNKTSFKDMFLLLFSWKQTAWQLWLENYHELKKEITISTKVLAAEKKQLNSYRNMLMDKKIGLTEQLKQLENALDLASFLTEQLEQRSESHHQLTPVVIAQMQGELLPVLQRRVVDLQQQLLIGRQTVMTIDIIAEQNTVQANSIDQALNTTSAALDVTAGLVLAEQGRKTLEKLGKQQEHNGKPASSNGHELKAVQHRIEQALQQMDETRKVYKQSIHNKDS